MEKNRGKHAVLTKHVKNKQHQFKSKLLSFDKWILPLFVLYGLRDTRSNTVNPYEIAQFFTPKDDEELYNKIIDELYRFAEYVSKEENETFLAVLTSGIHFDNPEILESFYGDEKYISHKQPINEYDITKYIFHGRKNKNWYSSTLATFKKMLPTHDTELFVKIFAITSARTHFKANIINAFKAYNLFKEGKLFSQQGFLPGVVVMLNDFRDGIFTFNGEERNGRRKISQFARAILGDKNAVVVDSWIMEGYGFSEYYKWRGKVNQYTPRVVEYDLIERHILLLAEAAVCEPRQIVSMLWGGIKAINSKYKSISTTEVLKEVINQQKSHQG